MKRKSYFALFSLVIVGLVGCSKQGMIESPATSTPTSVLAETEDDGSWPREITIPQGIVVIYQPQPDVLDGNILKGRAAVAVELKGAKEAVFGAVWLEARLETDRDERTATITEVSVPKVRFPEQDEEKAKKLRALLEKEIPKWQLPISLDRLAATLELAEQRVEAAKRIKTDPPDIRFVPEPAVLISLDGEPRLKEEEGAKLMRVINTPFTLLFMPSKKTYYLYAEDDTWYAANEIGGKWDIAENVPAEVASRAPEKQASAAEGQAPEEGTGETGPPPRVIVVTEPTELISSKGEPEYTPISGTDLHYMSNTDSDVLLDIGKKEHYVLLAGRWFASKTLDGPWRYVPGENLPSDFRKIPEDSEMGTVLYAVPGTDVAKDAVLDAQIPQTATVDRKQAALVVTYDGPPRFEAIQGTKMTYAVNTATPVIKTGNQFYACDEAIWFTAGNPQGPWQVASVVPAEIYTIPPESPLYHVTFVRIFCDTPDEVCVGYLPGYTQTYVYESTIVYGTGYWYPGWYGRWYYPRPATWGFHVRWNPWTGWRSGFSYGYGPYRFAIGAGLWYHGGWWGPGGYRGYHRGYRHGYRHGRNAGYRAGYRSGRRQAAHNNLYRSRRNQARVRAQSVNTRNLATSRVAKNRPNNVYADRSGKVHRRTEQGWQTRTNQGWQTQQVQQRRQVQKQQIQQRRQAQKTQQAVRTQRPQSKRTVQQSRTQRTRSTQHLQRSHQTRQRGAQRARSHSQSRGRSGGGGRGGGGRR